MFHERLRLLLILFAIGMSAVVARLTWLQVVRHDEFREQSLAELLRFEPIPSLRGAILDRNGDVLAGNRVVYDLALVPYAVDTSLPDAAGPEAFASAAITAPSVQAVLADLDRLYPEAGVEAAQVRERLAAAWPDLEDTFERRCRYERRISGRQVLKDEWRRSIRIGVHREPVVVHTDLPKDAALHVEIHRDRYPGAQVTARAVRTYPRGSVACHLLGVVGRPTWEEDRRYFRLNSSETPITGPDGRPARDPDTGEVLTVRHPGILGLRDEDPEAFRRAVDDGLIPWRLVEELGIERYGELNKNRWFHHRMIGREGLERSMQHVLKWEYGVRHFRRDPRNRTRTAVGEVPAVPAGDVVLTVDADLQEAVEDILDRGLRRAGTGYGSRAGAVVVLDVHTGAVLSMATSPRYDVNVRVPPVSVEDWRALADDPDAPLVHRAVGGRYAPGSVWKFVTAVAALEAGGMGAESHFTCDGHVNFGPARIQCMSRWGHGSIDMETAFVKSCNAYFIQAGLQTGVDGLRTWGERLGFGRRTGIELPGEHPGVVPDPPYKRTVMGRGRDMWLPIDTGNTSIGQGFVEVTPLQVARMTASIANGGRLVTPHLVAAVRQADGTVRDVPHPAPTPIGLSDATLAFLHEASDGVVTDRSGTAHDPRLADRERAVRAAGKTGSAEFRVLVSDDGRTERSNHAWFAGWAPRDNPRVAIAVLVEGNARERRLHGGSDAWPVALEVLEEVLGVER